MAEKTCTLSGCERKHYGKGLCKMHYTRAARHGAPGSAEPERVAGRLCSIDGCERPHHARGLCGTHLTRVYRTGDVHDAGQRFVPPALSMEQHPSWKGEDAGYHAIHKRLGALRGPAREFDCTDCGQQAVHWSYDHSDPDEKASDEGPYSIDPAHYAPRCHACHITFDRRLVVG